jgi:poly-gamma-glutamate synthesis protein (capsule biosynthesis protein)
MRGRRLALLACLAWGCQSCQSSQSAEPRAKAASAEAASAEAATATVAAVAAASAPPAPSSATPAAAPEEPVRVSFAGDLCMSLNVGTFLDKQREGAAVPPTVEEGYPFTHVAARLQSADLLVGNLECVLSLQGDVATDHNPFRCAMSSPEVLLGAGFDLVSVANNHAKDFGDRAFRDMLANLEAAKLPHFGKETFTRALQAPFIREIRGVKIGLLAYYWPPERPFRDVTEARPQVDVLFAFMHWGKEDQPEPMEMQRKLARELIDAGVDVVVGTHAHVLQPTDWYKGKLIAYGLGNFVFSGMMHSELHRVGALLEVDLLPGRIVAYRMIRTRLEADGAPRFLDDPEATPPIETK